MEKDCKFIEFCCGTGFVGEALKATDHFIPIIEGLDGSSKMLERAKEKNIYTSLHEIFLGTGDLPE